MVVSLVAMDGRMTQPEAYSEVSKRDTGQKSLVENLLDG
jgi:hypothetical protein